MSTSNTFRQRFSQFNIAEKLILINVVCFVVPFFLRSIFFLFDLPAQSFLSFFELPSSIGDFIYQPWSLLTYGFLHDSIGHIFWNMLLLYYASQFFLNLFSSQRFINVYFMGILLGGLVFILSYAIFPAFKNQSPQMVGASAGVMAVLIFSCTYMPTQEVRLLFFNVKLMYIGIALVIVDVLQIPTGNAGGHLAHIGGAALGYIYAQQLQNGKDIGTGFERLWKWLISLFSTQSNMKTVYKTSKRNSKKTMNSDQEKIDRILDKISASGYDSLTKEEKEMLFNAGKK
jgi:membrane associated rhomboid family serine protease